MDKISASIVLYNSPVEDIVNIINSFTAVPGNNTLFLIDNSIKGSSEIYAHYNKVEYIHSTKNIGYGSAHNIALRKSVAAGYKYHFILNPDVMFTPDVIPAICKYMEANADVGLVMPKIMYQNGDNQYLCKLLPTPVDLFVRRFLPDWLTQKRTDKFELRTTGYNKIMEVPFLSGCFMAIRRESIEQCGMFDERFFMYGEDIDFSRRINERFKTIFYPHVSITHGYEAASYKSFKMLKIHTQSIIRYFNKWGWFFDKRRKQTNKRILDQLNKLL
jgi:GT2 family glycosyltransferase